MPDTFGLKKKVSIIIPALNEEKLIERLLKQFNQDIKNKYDIEVIVSDGGSKDSTIQIAKKYADRIILNIEYFPQNISRGRNEGARNSRGDVLIFLNADTFVLDLNYLLEETIKEFSNDKISAIACPVFVFPDEAKISDKIFHSFYNNYVMILNKMIMGMGRGECHIVRRDKFFQAGGYREELAAGEDFDLYKKLRKSGKIKFRKDFTIYESPRRYRKYGYMSVILDWAMNSVSVLLFNKSISKKWDAVR